MSKTNALLTACTLSLALFAIGCGGPASKCGKAIDNATELSLSMLDGLTGMMAMAGEAGKAKAEEAKKELRATIAEKKPAAVEACVKAIKDDPKAEEAVVCVGKAKSIADLEGCSGADFLKAALK